MCNQHGVYAFEATQPRFVRVRVCTAVCVRDQILLKEIVRYAWGVAARANACLKCGHGQANILYTV